MDREFHLTTYAGSNANSLSEMIERFWNTTQHYCRRFAEDADEMTLWTMHIEHSLLDEAIKSLDLDEGERILAGHISRKRRKLARVPSCA